MHAELVVAVLGVICLAISIWTVQTFHLIVWKHALYFFIVGITLFTFHEFLLGFNITSSRLVASLFELGAILPIVYGIQKLRETAETLGV